MSEIAGPNTATYSVEVLEDRPHALAVRIAVFRFEGDKTTGDIFSHTLTISLPQEMIDAYLFRPDPITEASLHQNMVGFAKQRHVDEAIKSLVTSCIVFVAKNHDWNVEQLIGSITSS